MSNSPSFGGTITGGIQDISALLPLLGTDQCEKHVGSALDGGFLYSAVTPISIFGSLGIVRASFNILVTSLSSSRFQFLGARLLHHSGFSLSGTVAPMIALDPQHPDRFLAETKLEAMLAEEHIDNVPDLTVSWPKGTVQWNLMLLVSTLVISSAGLVPYISLIIDSGDTNPKFFFPLGFGFPVLRIFGSAVCVIIAQFLIQLRTLIIMKSRLLVISIDRLAKENKVGDLSSQINAGLKWENGYRDNEWSTEVAAEKCLWALQNWLSNRPDMERGESYRQVEALYTSEYTQHFGPINALILSWIPIFLCFSLAIGCISTVVGYVGCFFLVQHSGSSKGTLLWLLLEAVLSVLRIFVWAVNPSWDDSKGIKFELRLFTSHSILTCDKTMDEMVGKNMSAWIPESNANLEDVVAFAGPRPTFSVRGVEFFYTVAINSPDNPSKCLLIVISTEKLRRSRLLFKEAVNRPFTIYQCTLRELSETSLIELALLNQTQHDSHVLTSDPVFMAELEAHYDEINFRLQNRDTTSTEDQRVSFENTWAMQQVLIETTNNNWQPTKVQPGPPVLTEADKSCFGYYSMQDDCAFLLMAMDHWIDSQTAAYKNWLTHIPPMTMLPPADQAGIGDEAAPFQVLEQYEAIEKVYLFVEYQQHLEQFRICILAKWANDICSRHADMIEANLKSFSEGPAKSEHLGVSTTRERQRDSIHEHRLKAKLFAERDLFLKGRYHERLEVVIPRYETMHQQLSEQWGVNNDNDVQISHRVEALREEVMRLYHTLSLSVSHPSLDLAEIFRLPPNLAASFNDAASVLERYCILLQHHTTKFVEEVEQRFANYPFNSDKEVKAMVDQARAGCSTRAHQLLEMLTPSDTIGLKGVIDSPGLPSIPQLKNILTELSQDWKKQLQGNKDELAKMGTASGEKPIAQAKITEYFVKRTLQGQRLRSPRTTFEASANPSGKKADSHLPV